MRFLVAGIGDGLSTFFEADASSTTRQPTMAARQAAERGAVTPALDRVIEANTLLSGLGFESGGLAEAACAEGETIHNEPFPVTPEMVIPAMLAADALGAERRALLERTAELPEACA